MLIFFIRHPFIFPVLPTSINYLPLSKFSIFKKMNVCDNICLFEGYYGNTWHKAVLLSRKFLRDRRIAVVVTHLFQQTNNRVARWIVCEHIFKMSSRGYKCVMTATENDRNPFHWIMNYRNIMTSSLFALIFSKGISWNKTKQKLKKVKMKKAPTLNNYQRSAEPLKRRLPVQFCTMRLPLWCM